MKGNDKMKKIIATVLLFSMICSVMPSAKVQAAGKEKAYKAYYEWLQKEAPSLYKKYKLVKLDGDNIPELVGYAKEDGAFLYYYIICSYDGKKVNTKTFEEGAFGSFRGGASYIPKKGKIHVSSMSSGTGKGSDDLCTLKKGKFKETELGTFQLNMSYKWKKKKVSEKVYYKKLDQAFDSSKAKSFSDLKYISKSKMKKKLK